jgi:molecular chaperone GrpE
MTEVTKNQLLEQFRAYLESSEATTCSEEDESTTDLLALFTEMAGLRNEVKLEARQFKTALDQFKTVVDEWQTSQHTWQEELEERNLKQRRELLRSLLLEVVDIYDRLEASLTALTNYKPSRWTWFCEREVRFIRGLQEGQAITLRRCQQLLGRYRVRPLEVLNQPLDPHCMQVVEVDSQPNLPNGIVTGELRKGFWWEEELLRPAEVKVNKTETRT